MFEKLQKKIIEAPVLAYFDRFKKIITKFDSFNYVTGGVLS
jgi:hypothetical protein